MAHLPLILVVFAFVFEVIATFWNPQPPNAPPRWSFMAAGLACYFLYIIITGLPSFTR